MYKTGQLVKARLKLLPFIFHYGIVIVYGDSVCIMHNTTNRDSVIDSFDYWASLYTIESVYNTELMNISVDEILDRFETVCTKRYQLLDYNCEHFIGCMLNQKGESKQVQGFYKIVVSIGLLGILRRLTLS